jgi:hypothetical protein
MTAQARATQGSADASDPTWVGKGLESYFSFNGSSCYFREPGTQTWADAWHQSNGAFSMVFLIRTPASPSGMLFNTSLAGASSRGVNVGAGLGGTVSTQVQVDGNGSAWVVSSSQPTPAQRNFFYGVSVSDQTDVAHTVTSRAVDAHAGGYSSPVNASPATSFNCLGASDDGGTSYLALGTRFYMAAAWSRALSRDVLLALRDAMHLRAPY